MDIDDEFENDPINYLRKGQRNLANQVQALRNENQLLAAQNASLNISKQVEQFARENEHYQDAVEYIEQKRRAELKKEGVSGDEATKRINAEGGLLAETSLRNGQNPAELYYELAKRSGFQEEPGIFDDDPIVDQKFEEMERAHRAHLLGLD